MNKAKTIFFGLIFLILISSSYAVPASQVNENGLQLSYPPFETGKMNQALEFPFHVYRIADGVAINTSVNCILHVYDAMGNHLLILNQSSVAHGFDYEFAIPANTFNYTGYFSFNAYCQCTACSLANDDLGGHVKQVFFISATGYEENRQGTGLLAIVILIPILLGLFLIIGAATLGGEHNVLKIILFLLTPIMVWISSHYAMIGVVNYYGLTSLQEAIGDTTYWSAWIFFVIVSYFIIYAIWKAAETMAQKKKAKLEY